MHYRRHVVMADSANPSTAAHPSSTYIGPTTFAPFVTPPQYQQQYSSVPLACIRRGLGAAP
jgi:hypothetical protein